MTDYSSWKEIKDKVLSKLVIFNIFKYLSYLDVNNFCIADKEIGNLLDRSKYWNLELDNINIKYGNICNTKTGKCLHNMPIDYQKMLEISNTKETVITAEAVVNIFLYSKSLCIAKIYYSHSVNLKDGLNMEDIQKISRYLPYLDNKKRLSISHLEINQHNSRNVPPSAKQIDKFYMKFPENLKDLSITLSDIEEYSENIFENMYKLKNLHLGNRIKLLSERIFHPLGNLRMLFLCHNKIENLPDEIFKGLSSLEYLNVAGNKITSVSKNIFSSLHNLRRVIFCGNKISKLDKNIFSGLDNLQTVDFSNNEITELNTNIFMNIPKIEEIYFEHNKIKELPEGIFSRTFNLKEIKIGRNLLDTLPERIFSNLHQLTLIDMADNNIQSSLSDIIFKGLSRLNMLIIDRNAISERMKGLNKVEIYFDHMYDIMEVEPFRY